MRATKRWWILVLAVALLVVPACTENDLDESDADVILEVLGFTSPNVEATDVEGACSLDGTVECTSNQDCAVQNLGSCIFDPTSGCDPQPWVFTMFNEPLSEDAGNSALNDVTVNSVTIGYTWPVGTPPGAIISATVPLGTVIDVNGNGTVGFKPIVNTVIPDAPTDVGLVFVWNATTVSGQSVSVFGGSGGVLTIEDCLGP